MPVNIKKIEVDKAKERILRFVKEKKISAKNAQFILDMVKEESAARNDFGLNRQLKYLVLLSILARQYNKDFDKVTKKDLIPLVSWIKEKYHGETPRDFLVILRRFIRWIRIQDGNSYGKNEFPPEVAWIQPTNKAHKQKLPDDLLTEEDVLKLAEHTLNPRDGAIIITLYETGMRIGELLALQIKDVEFDQIGAKITVPNEGKTGSRKLRVIACAPTLANWLREHPNQKNKDASLFCGIWSKKKGLQIDYRTVYNLLQDATKRASLNKPCNPHHFRHSRASRLALQMTEAQLCYYMGWVVGSKEARTYVHLSGRDTEDAILEMYGLSKKEDHITRLKPVKCPRCGKVNDSSMSFCGACRLGLDQASVMQYDNQKEQALRLGFGIINTPDFEDSVGNILLKKIKEMEEKITALQNIKP